MKHTKKEISSLSCQENRCGLSKNFVFSTRLFLTRGWRFPASVKANSDNVKAKTDNVKASSFRYKVGSQQLKYAAG